MKIPLDISLHGLSRSEAVEAKIRERVLLLGRYSRRIQRCEVWLDALHGHHRKGFVYTARIRLTVPGAEIAVDSQPREEDVYVAIRQAFDAARRQLQDSERRRPGHARGLGALRRAPSRSESRDEPSRGTVPGGASASLAAAPSPADQ